MKISISKDLVKKEVGNKKAYKDFLNLVAKNYDITLDEARQLVHEPSMYQLVKAFGFSLKNIAHSVHAASQLIPKGLEAACTDLHKNETMQKIHVGAQQVDEVLDKYPVIKKITGPAMAGLIFMMESSKAALGTSDIDTSAHHSHLLNALGGKYSIADTFTSPEGLASMSLVVAGVASGGVLSLPMFGHTANLMASIVLPAARQLRASPWADKVYRACHKKLLPSINVLKKTKFADYARKSLTGIHDVLKTSVRTGTVETGDWFDKLTKEDQKAYIKKHPHSKHAPKVVDTYKRHVEKKKSVSAEVKETVVTLKGKPECVDRVLALLTMVYLNGSYGHSGLFGISWDGDGSDKFDLSFDGQKEFIKQNKDGVNACSDYGGNVEYVGEGNTYFVQNGKDTTNKRVWPKDKT